MRYLAWLEKTLGAKLEEQPIGRPVYVRAFLKLTPDHGLLRGVAEEGVRVAAGWMNVAVAESFWQGGEREGYVSAMVRFRDGRAALIASELTQGDEPEVDVLVVGQQGSLRFEDVVLA
jgi:predicted dehydrogenase